MTIETAGTLVEQGNSIAIYQTPAHVGVAGNEVVDLWAKVATASASNGVERALRSKASLAFISRRIAEAKSRIAAGWVGTHSRDSAGTVPQGARRSSRS